MGTAQERMAKRIKSGDKGTIRRLTSLEKRIYAIETGPETWMLTQAEKLAILNRPSNIEKSQRDRLDAVHKRPTSMETYRKTLRDPWFVELINRGFTECVRAAIPAVLDAAIQVATKPTQQGYQDRKLLLGMAGIYNERLDVGVEGNIIHETGDRLSAALARAAEQRARIAARRTGQDNESQDGTTLVIDVTPERPEGAS